MPRWNILIMAVLCGLAAALASGVAGATVGGEWLCDVLGREEATGRIYVHQIYGGGNDSFGIVAWLETTGPDAGVLKGVDWNRWGEGSARDPDLARRLAELRARLAPLPALTWPSLPFSSRTVARDSVPSDMGQCWRLRVQANFGLGPLLELTCWGNDRVARPTVYELPAGEGWLWIVAFTGDPFETGYETQIPVLVRPGEREGIVRAVEWRRLSD